MKIGIVGLPQSGKKVLFKLLTGHIASEDELSHKKPVRSIANICDPRFDTLVTMYSPRKQVKARIEVELLPDLEKESIAKGDIFANIDDVDAICLVVRAFEDDSVYHVEGSVDPRRDIESVTAEFIIHDLLFIEKRLGRIGKAREPEYIKEIAILTKLGAQLEKELPLRLVELSDDEEKVIASYPFITRKKLIIVLNVSEDGLGDTALASALLQDYQDLDIKIMQVSAKVEDEIAGLESEDERSEFMQALGIDEPAVDVLTRVCLEALDLISFFTVGADEVRQWTIRSGSSAPQAAGAIHSDLEKGFIRAEVIKYDDLIVLGSEDKVKEAGKFQVKGKDYIVEDGDIICIRFNV